MAQPPQKPPGGTKPPAQDPKQLRPDTPKQRVVPTAADKPKPTGGTLGGGISGSVRPADAKPGQPGHGTIAPISKRPLSPEKIISQINRPTFADMPPPGYSEQHDPNSIPNYDKLSGAERWIMNALPGITQKPGVGKTIVDALDYLNKSPAGKILGVLDLGAELLERQVGFNTQAIATLGDTKAMADFASHWKEAWYAGSLTSDFSAGLNVDTNASSGGLRVYFDNDMPGLDGLIRARQRIVQLTSGGMSHDDALKQAQEEALNDMGALALRAQLHDAFFHIAGDPLNVLMPFLKPVERLHAARNFILATKVTETTEFAKDVTRLEELAKGAENISKLAGEAGDIEKATQVANDIAKAVEGADNAEAITKSASEAAQAGDFAKLQSLASDVSKETKNALAAAEETLRMAQVKKLNAADRFIIGITGGAPGEVAKWWQKPNALNPLSWLALTPEAKAQEFTGLIIENINTRVIAGSRTVTGEYDINKIARAITRAADGTSGREFGHMIATLEGQHVKGVLKGVAMEVSQITKGFNAAGSFERPLARMIADVLGENIVRVVRQVENGEHGAILARFLERVDAIPDAGKFLDALLESKGLTRDLLTPDLLKSTLGIFKGEGLAAADSGLATAEIMSKIGDTASRQAVLRFGVQQRGLVQGIATLSKQAQTLAFLKLNPVYPVKNLVNNVFTMIARGAMGTFTPGAVEDFWKLRGLMPTRLLEGVGQAGDFAKAFSTLEEAEQAAIAAGKLSPIIAGTDKAAEVMRDATKFKTGWVQSATDWIGNINKDGWDFGVAAQKIERLSSAHALTVGYARGEQMFGRAGQMWSKIADYNPELYKELGPELSRVIEHLTEDANLNPARFDELISGGGDLNVSGSRLRDLVEKKLGRPVSSVLTDEFMASVQGDVVDAIRSRDATRIDATFAQMRNKLDMHIENMHDTAIEVLTQEALGRVKVEGPGAFTKLWGDAMDEWYGGVVRHDIDTAKLAEEIRKGTNPKLIDAQWQNMKLDSERYWKRQWDRLGARMDGMAQGAKGAGLQFESAEVSRNFKSWRKDWESFFEFRNQAHENFFAAQMKGEVPAQTWEQLTGELNSRYAKIANQEAQYAEAIDKSVADLLPADRKDLFLAWRKRINGWRLADKQEVQAFREGLRGVPAADLQKAYAAHWQKRIENAKQLWNEERMGLAALGGNQDALAAYQEGITHVQQLTMAERNAFQTAVKEAGFKDFKEATQAFLANPEDARFANLAPQVQAEIEKQGGLLGQVFQDRNFHPDFESLVKPEQITGAGLDQLIYTRGHDAVDAMREEALKMAGEKPLKFAGLSEEAQQQLLRYADHVKGGYADARYASTKFGEYTRDSALLNYNRRFNYNTFLGTIMPYEFWTTQSIYKWALHSIDRPAMLTTYLRMKKFLETAYSPQDGMPSRLKGTVRIPLPFVPEWMQGEGYIDPLRLALPFDSWLGIPEQMEKQWTSDQGATARKLEELLNDGQITQSEYAQATQTMAGPTWDRAMGMAQQDDSENRLNGADFAAMFSSPHAPLMWAMDAARGRETGAVMPLTNTIGSVLSALGIDPAGPLNPEAAIRKKMGYHPFNKWDDYYVERQLTNMVAEGVISANEARQAMASHEGDAYQKAYKRTWTERSGGPVGSFLGLLGLPVKSYPEGEEKLRQVKDDYEAAWHAYDAALEADDPKAYQNTVGKFLEANPGYEERLALFKKPEERLNQFLVDEVWNQWNSLPRLTQDELKDYFGNDFQDNFLNKDTRAPKNIPPGTLAVWLKLMGGGDPYGQLKGQYIPPAQITDRAVANQAQVFYDSRDQMFPGWRTLSDQFNQVPKESRVYVAPPEVAAFDQERKKRFGDAIYSLQDQYYALSKNERKGFRAQHPELQQYWDFKRQWESQHPEGAAYLKSDAPITKSQRSIWISQHPEYGQYLNWRKGWLLRNPDVAPYVTDSLPKGMVDTYKNEKPQPHFTWDEWKGQMGWSLANLYIDYVDHGEEMPAVGQQQLAKMAQQYGVSGGWKGMIQKIYGDAEQAH